MDSKWDTPNMNPKLDSTDYCVSAKTGFLLEDPLDKLPDYFEPWNSLSSRAVTLIDNQQLRNKVAMMELLDHSRLSGYRQHRLAHLQLSIITSGYVWQDGDDGVPQVLPACLSVPLCGVSDFLGLQPILSHVDLVLANYKKIDPDRPLSLGVICLVRLYSGVDDSDLCLGDEENIQCICHLPGGQEADWFVLTTVQVELDFIEAIQPLVQAIEAAEAEDANNLIDALTRITLVIGKIKKSLGKMHEGLAADTFYNVTRPFLTGWGGDGSPLPQGIIYEGVSDKPKPMTGGSAAQSSCLQCIDAVFHVVHTPDIQEFFQKMRYHMPPLHRKFIDECRKRSTVKQYVLASNSKLLETTYDCCIQSLIDLRSYHIQLVTKYIVIMSNRKSQKTDYKTVAKKGTGGSNLLPFLKTAREATMAAKATFDDLEKKGV